VLFFKIEQQISHGIPVICDANEVNKTAEIDEAQQKLEKVIGFLFNLISILK